MTDVLDRITAWEAEGIIDGATAARLRQTEAEATAAAAASGVDAGHVPVAPGAQRSAAAAMFGPSVTIAEVFVFLGGAFLVGAWSAFMSRTAASSEDPELALGVMALIAAAVLGAIGFRFSRGDERASRAAGVAFLLATSYVAGAFAAFATQAGVDWPAIGIVAAAAGLSVAVVARTIHPSVLTQVGVLASLTALAGSTLMWLQVTLFPEPSFPDLTGQPTAPGPDPVVLVIASAAWWLAVAVGIALIGLREARIAERDDDAAASRRAAVSRFWAGLLAVIGLAIAVGRSDVVDTDGNYGRVLEPWIGDLALLVLAGVLIERAFRRDATAFMYAAALALIIALTDFNVSYLSSTTEAALLIEGFILLGVGFGADRLRRRIGHRDDIPPPGPSLAAPGEAPVEAPA